MAINEFKEEKLVSVEAVVAEIKFQKEEMLKTLESWKVEADIVDIASDYFDVAVHGVEDHLSHYDKEKI